MLCQHHIANKSNMIEKHSMKSRDGIFVVTLTPKTQMCYTICKQILFNGNGNWSQWQIMTGRPVLNLTPVLILSVSHRHNALL